MDRPVLSAYLLWTIRFDRPIAENSPILPVYQLRTIRFYRSIASRPSDFSHYRSNATASAPPSRRLKTYCQPSSPQNHPPKSPCFLS